MYAKLLVAESSGQVDQINAFFEDLVALLRQSFFCDETSEIVCVEDSQTKEFHYRKKYVWGLVNPVQKYVYYLYESGSRSRKAISDFLGDFAGFIMTEAYNAYRMFAHGKPAERVQWQVCFADDSLTVYSDSLRKGVTYALTFWKQITLYIDHGDWDIDNNTGEYSMRPLAVGRNNFVGFGSHQGAILGACAYTFVENCKLNTISAYEYIKKVLTLIGDEKKEDTNDYSALLPSVLAIK